MTTPTSENAIVAEIVIGSTPERIFRALTDPGQRTQWWGSKGKFEVNHMESDLRVGGAWLMSGMGMEGKPFTLRGQYRAIDPPRLLEFTWVTEWGDAPTIVRFDLERANGATTVRVTHFGFKEETAKQFYRGWPLLLANLRAHSEKNPL